MRVKKIKKIFSRIHRKFIFLLDGVNYKRYMRKYNAWLKKNGMNIKGNAKFIHHSVYLDGVDYSKITLGNDVVISVDTILLVHDFSIEAALKSIGVGDAAHEAHFIKPISIGDNTFVGARCVILPGCKIGKNCIVGAGTVLTGKEYPDNSIIVGNPGRIIGDTQDFAKKNLDKNSFVRSNSTSSGKF